MDPSLFEFGVPGSQTAVATVDDGGLITAGKRPLLQQLQHPCVEILWAAVSA